MAKKILTIAGSSLLLLTGCQSNQTSQNANEKKAKVTKEVWGKLPNGTDIDLYTLTNYNGLEAKITNYGGIVVSLMTPDKNGKLEDVVLGFETLDEYMKDSPYFGCIVGRYGNRIAKGEFELNGTTYHLAKNDGENHLHGGIKGFDKVVWEAVPDTSAGEASLNLTYVSPDGEEGYPGNLEVRVVYTLTNKDELKITYFATTDKQTPVNLTHHGYFNLTGGAKRDILGHELSINSNGFLPVDGGLIPTGELRALNGTPFNFKSPKPIGDDINFDDVQLQMAQGYDHNWILAAHKPGGQPELAATVLEPESGRYMEVWTTEPGLQFYSGNFLDGKYKGKGGVIYQDRWGLCLETQHFPDSPNHLNFPSTILVPGDHYSSTTIYKFSVKNEK
ncbi:MAG: galactose-1-epimerase [Bacteroidetes bacterium]|nr:galactose-1-epimerase [Bacteroidota bacterium]